MSGVRRLLGKQMFDRDNIIMFVIIINNNKWTKNYPVLQNKQCETDEEFQREEYRKEAVWLVNYTSGPA